MRAEGELDPAHYLDPVSRVETQLMPSRDQAGQTIVADPPTDVKHGDQPSNDEHLDRQTERRLVRRIDLILMPLLTIAYGLQFLDKAVLGSASVFGIIRDLGLSTTTNGVVSTTRYSTANAAFYWGYIVGVLPLALVLQRVPLGKTLGAMIMIWGVVCILTMVVSSYEGLVVQRVFLGLIESSVSPGFVLISTRWYTKSELALRIGFWYSATGIFSMFSGVLFFGIGHADGALATWKYMYALAGSITIAFGAIFFLVCPDSIATSGRYFNERERAQLQARLQTNGAADTRFHADQLIEAVLDLRIWLMLTMAAAIYVVNGSVTAFGARIISTFGYTSLEALALQIPGGAATCVSIYLAGWTVGRYKNITTYVLAAWCIPPIIGSVIVWRASWAIKGWPVFGYTLLPVFGAPYVMLLTLASQNIGGGTKKAVAAGFIFIGYNVGNIIAPYMVFTSEASIHYRSTFIANIVVMCYTIGAALVLRFLLVLGNRRKERERESAWAALRESAPESVRDSFDDDKHGDRPSEWSSLHAYAHNLSDAKNPGFVYSL